MVFHKAWHAIGFVGVVLIGANELIGDSDDPGIIADHATVEATEDKAQLSGQSSPQSSGQPSSGSGAAGDRSQAAQRPPATGFDFDTWLAEDTQNEPGPSQVAQPDGATVVAASGGSAASRKPAGTARTPVARNSRNGQRAPGTRKRISAEGSDQRLARDLTEALRKKAS